MRLEIIIAIVVGVIGSWLLTSKDPESDKFGWLDDPDKPSPSGGLSAVYGPWRYRDKVRRVWTTGYDPAKKVFVGGTSDGGPLKSGPHILTAASPSALAIAMESVN